MCIKLKNGTRPPTRARHNWTSRVKLNSTLLHFKCGRVYHNIKLKGLHVTKLNESDMISDARLLRQPATNTFMFFADVSKYGANIASRLRGGYYHYIIESEGTGWLVSREFYSRKDVEDFPLGGKTDYNVMWEILNRCYYGVVTEETTGDGNSG